MESFISVGVNALIGMVTLFSISPSWAAQMMAMSQNKDVIAELTVPVRLSALDRRIHSGKVICTVTRKEASDITLQIGGMGSGNATFGINSSDGSFNGNVKVSVIHGKDFQDSDLAGELKYGCWLYLSPDGSTWQKPDVYSKDDMFKPKLSSTFVSVVTGNISAP